MRLSDVIKFQKTLALAAAASNKHEAEAAERAARRLVETCKLNPTRIPDKSFVSHVNLADYELLKKLRDEWRASHPHTKPKPKRTAKPVNTSKPKPSAASPTIPFSIDGFRKYAQKTKPVNTKPNKPRSASAAARAGSVDILAAVINACLCYPHLRCAREIVVPKLFRRTSKSALSCCERRDCR
jgi:hypothetical protein